MVSAVQLDLCQNRQNLFKETNKYKLVSQNIRKVVDPQGLEEYNIVVGLCILRKADEVKK